MYYVTCEYTTDRFGRKVECASTGGREVHPAALIFTACAVKTHMRKTGADPCPVEGETEARAQPSVPFSLCRSATTLRIVPVGCYGYVHACREQRRSDNPTLWVVTTTGDQSCRMSHRTSKCERKSGLRSLPASTLERRRLRTRPHGLSLLKSPGQKSPGQFRRSGLEWPHVTGFFVCWPPPLVNVLTLSALRAGDARAWDLSLAASHRA